MTQLANTKERRSSSWQAYALLSPGVGTILLLAVIPIFLVFRNSFAFSSPYGAVVGGLTFDNYRALFNPQYATTILNSLQLATINTLLCMLIGYIIAHYVVSQTATRQNFYLLLLIIPFWTDFLIRTYAVMALLGNGGPVQSAFGIFGIETGTLIPSKWAVMFGLVYAFLPTAVFPIYASMRSIEESVKEAARDLGCGWWRTHLRIIAPLSLPGLASAFMLTFIPSLGVFVIPVLLGGGKDLLVGNLIVTLYTEFRNQPVGAALSMMVLFLMLCLATIGLTILKIRNRER